SLGVCRISVMAGSARKSLAEPLLNPFRVKGKERPEVAAALFFSNSRKVWSGFPCRIASG
ncbi:hypothetical protein, partial [Mesorhizobium sp.]|uniref:hypothetical protein n=1 Tax=Mesorhizobium sp. TaxID=1871066 RepID=UPI0025C39B83